MTNLTGFVNIVKPTGMTSSDVVLKVKKILKTKKVGHLGTLDPAASGVLPIAVGKATKFFDYFLSKEKEYIAIVKFGIETDTLDSFGNITIKENVGVSKQMIENVLNKFIGDIEQIPPKYSAIKINGKKACDLAREDISFEIKPRKIHIFSINLLDELDKNIFMFKVHCSAGTYIRTLFSDIAKEIGTISTTPVIIRTRSGRFDSSNSITLEELEQTLKIQTIEDIFADIKKLEVTDELAKKLINGVKISALEIPVKINDNEECLIVNDNRLIGFYKAENNALVQLVYLYEG